MLGVRYFNSSKLQAILESIGIVKWLVTVCEHLTPEIEEMNDEKSKASVFRYSGKNSTVITSMLETKIKENYKKLQVF